jgi:hypothetical protein
MGLGADYELPLHVRFIAGAAKLIRKRRAITNGKTDAIEPAIFLLQPTPPDLGAPARRVPMLDNGLTPLTGRLWFVNAVVNVGKYIELSGEEDDELFRRIAEDFRLGDVQAIVFDPRAESIEIRYYPRGLQNPDICELISVSGTDISLDGIFAAIDRIHQNCFVTPDAQSLSGKLRLWKDSSKWLPSSDAEAIIQMNLKAGLTTAFPTCTVRHEQPQVSGRLDLEIEESDPLDCGHITRHAILELKVLRSFSETGTPVPSEKTLDDVTSGVQQAAAYRDEKCARASALCCFDMRREPSGETCFKHIRNTAKDTCVRLRLWFIFATSKLYRATLVPLGLQEH